MHPDSSYGDTSQGRLLTLIEQDDSQHISSRYRKAIRTQPFYLRSKRHSSPAATENLIRYLSIREAMSVYIHVVVFVLRMCSYYTDLPDVDLREPG